jgi:hypothetical protein
VDKAHFRGFISSATLGPPKCLAHLQKSAPTLNTTMADLTSDTLCVVVLRVQPTIPRLLLGKLRIRETCAMGMNKNFAVRRVTLRNWIFIVVREKAHGANARAHFGRHATEQARSPWLIFDKAHQARD